MGNRVSFRTALLTTAALSIAATAVPAFAADPGASDPSPDIVIRDGIDPNQPAPAGDLDDGVTGIGQITTDLGGGSVGLCTGTLINPRTVIFASHCVNELPADAYGAASGGVGISVGFSPDNFNPILSWLLGIGGPKFGTNTNLNIYNIEQVWYDPRALQNPNARGFLEADIALGTLDTPAFGVPTWALLFSPLTQEEHVSIVGYGGAGNGTVGDSLGIDFRRRSAENMVSFLGSLDTVDFALFGPPLDGLPQNLYMTDFDDPNFGTANANPFDFNIFGGAATPREGITAGGDSGGPLIVDQKYDRPVVAGVLSGGSRFFGPQPDASYGTTSIYQPLYLFWDAIVANNPYVYADNKAGNADWMDPRHWVQAMDPNYTIDVNGQLVNGLPDTPALGISGDGATFGKVCFFDSCIDPQTGVAPTGDGTPIFIPGGPGSTNFVPNNVVGNPALGIKSHYYDVTLSAPGTTRLKDSVTIDRLTIKGLTKLDIKNQGSLKVWGDMTQIAGWTNVDGLLTTGESLYVTGILSGSGVLDPTYLTAINTIVSPGSDNDPSTLTVKGDVILSSGSTLAIDVNHKASDLFNVVGDSLNNGILALDGGTVLFTRAKGSKPRDGDTFTFASATGGVDGTFGNVASLLGILQADLTYGPNDVTAKLRAGRFIDFLTNANSLVTAFANAFDALRGSSYSSLSGLYGNIDLMSPDALAATFENLAPRISDETRTLQDRQSKQMLTTVSNRLSMLGTPQQTGLSVYGMPSAFGLRDQGVYRQGMTDLGMSHSYATGLPSGMSAFVAGGSSAHSSAYGGATFGQGEFSTYMSSGLEYRVAPRLTFGTAIGYAEGSSAPGADQSKTKTSQVAMYGSYRLGGGAYVGGLAAAETSRAEMSRNVSTGDTILDLTGATRSQRYTASIEAGVNVGVADKLMLTPRAQLAYSNYHLDGFSENGGEAALRMDDLRLQKVEARIGAKLTGSASLGKGWSFVPELEANYVRLVSGADDGMAVRFANAADYRFFLPIADGGRSRGEVRGGLRLTNGPLEVGTAVQASIGGGALDDRRATADVTLRF
jgi:outer membrane autotransporter protein